MSVGIANREAWLIELLADHIGTSEEILNDVGKIDEAQTECISLKMDCICEASHKPNTTLRQK